MTGSQYPTTTRARGVAALALIATLGLSACAGSPARGSGTGSGTNASPTIGARATAATYPVTVNNCGTSVTIAKAPQRIVTIKSSMTELALALGVADRMVGVAFLDDPIPAPWAAAAAKIPVLSDQVPGEEALLTAQPDLVLGGWESNFSADGAGTRDQLATVGVNTYVAPSACKEPSAKPDPLTFDLLFDQITEAGRVLGVPQAAADLVAAQQARLATVTAPAAPTTALWYSSGSDAPYVGAGIGAPQMMMNAAGLTNVFADVHDTWTSASWEEVVARDPSVIVLVDATWNTAAHKIQMLEANPATRELSAVRSHRYLTIPFAASEAGVRNVDAVASLAEQLSTLPAQG